MSPLNLKAKDLCILYDISLPTAKRKIRDIKTIFGIENPRTVSINEVAIYFGTDPELLTIKITEL